MKLTRNTLRAAALAAATAFTSSVQAWEGMPTPPLHVSGRFLQDPGGNNVLLHGWMQPEETWFNGEGNRYSNPTDWTNPSNVAGMLNFLRDAATVMSDTSPKYGRSHGWYASFVRVNCDFYGGWTAENGLVNSSQFNGWIQNFVVPYAQHLSSRGLYLVLCATGPINTPDNGTHNAGIEEQQRLRTLWSTIANAPGVKNADNIMFELMNEPVQVESSPGNGNWGSGSGPFFQAFRNWIQPIINDIRGTGANNVIWVPCLGWQGEPHGWAQYPFSGSNIGVAAHFYPAYGGVYDNAAAVQNLWNSNYKPAADLWPMIITECYWYPGGTGYEDLFNGTTAGFGNALKNAMDNQGNVSFLVGFLADHLVDLANSTPANCTLGPRQGTQAYFEWLPTYTWAAPGSGGGGTRSAFTQIEAESFDSQSGIQTENCSEGGLDVGFIENGDYVVYNDIDFGGGATSFQARVASATSGGNIEIRLDSVTGPLVGTCAVSGTGGWQTWATVSTSVSGASGVHNLCLVFTGGGGYLFNVNWLQFTGGGELPDGTYRIIARHSGKAMDASGAGTANGTQIIQWTYGGGANQQWVVTDEGGGEYSIIGVQSGRAIDIDNWGTANGSKVQLWDYFGGTNQKFFITATSGGYYRISPTHAPDSCLDVEGISTSDGALVHLWQWLNGNNQQWTFQAP